MAAVVAAAVAVVAVAAVGCGAMPMTTAGVVSEGPAAWPVYAAKRHLFEKHMVEFHRQQREVQLEEAAMPSSSLPAPRFVTQRLDHFDGSDTTTWQQAYYVNSTYFQAGSDAPVYLCVGGEGPPLDGSVVVASVHCNVAVELLPKTGAIMFALEHRYYGCHNMSACPVENPLAKGALRYLSSRQALGDLAAFISYIRQQYNLPNNKIVTFGGSYPGMLAGWARLKYPHLVHASVASSAPVEAVLDMRGYYDVTAFAYSVSDNNVGGSDACRAAIATGHATIGQYFNSSSGRNTLANIFGLPASYFEKYDNQASFAGGGVAYFPSQSNDPSCTQAGCNINLICQVMTNTSLGDEVHRLAVVRKQQLEWLPAAFESFATKTLRVGAEADYWGYQTCTEFAFYQTCEVGSDCFFTQGYLTLNATEAACQAEFGIDFTTVQQNVIASNAWYGGRNSAGSCLMYPNGEVDPWNSQSILNTTAPGITTLMVPGASHHAWTHPSAPSDQPSVVAARKTIADFVSNALNQACGQV